MKGTIINQQNLMLTIACEQGLYQASLSEQAQKLGYEAEFEPLSPPSLLRPGQAKLIESHEYSFDRTDFLVSKHLKIAGYRIMACPEDPYLAAEGASLEQAFDALKALAEQYQANALLNLQAQYKVNRLCGKCLFKLTARAAYLVKETELAEERRVNLPLKIARRNSPNRAQQRYLRVLCICALLIFCPILVKLWGSGQLLLWQLELGAAALFALSGGVFIGYFPCKVKAYLLRAANRQTI